MIPPLSEQEPKLFTLAEVNKLIPQVNRLLNELRKKKDAVLTIEQEKAVEELSWLQPDGAVSPKAQKEVGRLEIEIEQATRDFENLLGRFGALGAQLKDLEEGLVDFLSERNGELVYLCWKEGEGQIRFWHDLESGFAGRRTIDSLL